MTSSPTRLPGAMETNIETTNVNEHNMVKNLYCQEADQLAIFKSAHLSIFTNLCTSYHYIMLVLERL